MNGIVVLVSLAAIGVDYGWQPLPDGRLEYIVQIEPGLLDELKTGEEIVSEILPEARNVRRFRIRVGTGDVPRVGHSRGDTASRSLTPGHSGETSGNARPNGEFSVLPPRADPAYSSVTRGDGMPENFGPEGFLNLPPPPPLLGLDGKNSVLVPPGSRSEDVKPDGGGSQDILPPDVSGNGAGNSASDPSNPSAPGEDASSSSSDSVAGQFEEPGAENGSLNPPQFDDGIYPPSSGRDLPSSGESGSMVLPPTGESRRGWPGRGTSGSSGHNPVREPSPDSDPPNPIRFGDSGVKAPGADSKATHGPESPPSASRQERSSGEQGRRSSNDGLLAKTNGLEPKHDSEAAAFKPSMDKETAEKLEPKPWTPLVLTSLALFASLAANAYLGWVALGIYRRYRDIVSQLHQAQSSPA